MSGLELIVAIAIAVGLLGVVLPLLPGTIIIAVAIVSWAGFGNDSSAWWFAGVAVTILLVGGVVKFLIPGRQLKARAIPNRSLFAGAVAGIVGFFVVPLIGLLLGFVAGVYLAELARLGSAAAWPSTKHAVKAVGLSILLELAAGLLAATAWGLGVVLT